MILPLPFCFASKQFVWSYFYDMKFLPILQEKTACHFVEKGRPFLATSVFFSKYHGINKDSGALLSRGAAIFQMRAILFSRYSQTVKVKALHTVVSITALALSTPSWPMLRAMLKQLTVAGEPSMINSAVNVSPR